MALLDRAPVRRVREPPELVELNATARSAEDAARAAGGADSEVPDLPGRRVGEAGTGAGERRIAGLLGEPIEKADAAFVRERSGFAIGGVPPVGHTVPPVAFVDQDLLAEGEVWSSAGHTHVVFGLDPAELPRITGGRIVRVTDDGGRRPPSIPSRVPPVSAANISVVRNGSEKSGFLSWLAWGRRRRANKVLFSLSVGLAAFVTLAFAWAAFNPDPGNGTRYLAFLWVWGLCALGILLAMAEYKTSPLRKAREPARLYILLYIGMLLIVTRALNMVLYHG